MPVAVYDGWVKPEQRVIADWIVRTAEKHGLSLGAWAKRAKIGAETTVTRAVKDEYPSVTTVTTLDALAKAVSEPSVLDFLAQPSQAEVRVPSEAALASLLSAILPLAPRGRASVQSTRVVAAALQHGLELLGDQSASDDPAAIGVAARGATARLRDLLQQ